LHGSGSCNITGFRLVDVVDWSLEGGGPGGEGNGGSTAHINSLSAKNEIEIFEVNDDLTGRLANFVDGVVLPICGNGINSDNLLGPSI
jgi:hypothetical protein